MERLWKIGSEVSFCSLLRIQSVAVVVRRGKCPNHLKMVWAFGT